MAFLTTDPISLDALIAQVRGPARGGIATFLGMVRDHHEGRRVLGLEYSAYGEMAEVECGRIVADAEEKWPCRVAVRHRLGPLEVGHVAVAIAVAAGHRGDAFAACRYVIEEVKRRLPIWKRERYQDGTEAWVDPTASGGVVPARETAGP